MLIYTVPVFCVPWLARGFKTHAEQTPMGPQSPPGWGSDAVILEDGRSPEASVVFTVVLISGHGVMDAPKYWEVVWLTSQSYFTTAGNVFIWSGDGVWFRSHSSADEISLSCWLKQTFGHFAVIPCVLALSQAEGNPTMRQTQSQPSWGLQSQTQARDHVFTPSVVPDSLWPHGLQPARLLCPWDSPGKNNTGVGWHALLQGIFLTQGLNLGLLCLQHWQVDSLPLCHLGSQRLGNCYANEHTLSKGRSLGIHEGHQVTCDDFTSDVYREKTDW